MEDNYQKQTYRNRTHICNDRGRHLLSIPIQHVGGNQGRQKYKDVKIENQYTWQRNHWRTLQTAYRTSPFFEFYEDDIAHLYEKRHEFLLDYNLETIAVICECFQIDMPTERTNVYELHTQNEKDIRFLVNAKKDVKLSQTPYTQVFGERHGFIENVSVLDLLFNVGTNALAYLRQQELPPSNA